MSLIYETIGRLVVELVSRRYRREIRLISASTVVFALLLAVLWALFGRQRSASFSLAGPSAAGMRGRKQRSGAILSIR